MKNESLGSDIRTAIDVALLKDKAMHQVASDKNKTMVALGIIVVAALLSALGLRYFGGFVSLSWGGVISSALFQIVSMIIGIYVLSAIAKGLFKGHAKHDEFFRVLGFGLIVTWLGIIPALGIVGGIWAIVVLFSVLKKVHKLSVGNSIVAVILAIVAMFIINMALVPVLGFVGIKGYGGGMDFRAGKYFDNGFKMNFNSDEGTSTMKMEGNKMTIEGPEGETMEIEIPDYN